MASEVQICNLALGHLGDTAEIASLSEASVQAQLCKKFYGPARDALLEMNAWGFSTRRVLLSEVVNPWAQWQHAYGMPAGVLNVLAVLDANAPADITANLGAYPNQTWPESYMPAPGAVVMLPQPYTLEIDEKGNAILLTNQCNALLRFTMKVIDSTKFSPLFTLALSWLLASHLAGPIIKGETGTAEAKRCLQMFQAIVSQAKVSDANQSYSTAEVSVPWIAGR